MGSKQLDVEALDSFLRENASFIENITSSDPLLQFQAVQKFRKILHNDEYETRQLMIESGLIPRFLELLKDFEHPNTQFEAAWALTNILSGSSEQTQFVVDLDAIPLLIDLLKSGRGDDVRAQAVWALGNIVGDGRENRDRVLEAGALPIILGILQVPPSGLKIDMVRNVAWILSNVFKRQPRPPLDMMKQSMPVLVGLLSWPDDEVLKDTCWTFSFIADGTLDRIQLVIDAGVLPRIAHILTQYQSKAEITRPAVRILGSIAAGDDLQTQAVLTSGALSADSDECSSSNTTRECL